MDREVTVAMVALGGYGNTYLKGLFEEADAHNVRLVAGIDPNPVRCHYLDCFEAAGIPIYPDLEHFYAKDHAELVVIAAPIQLHAPFTITALAHGSNVLCEKPIAATIQEVAQMAAAEREAEGFVGIGYQWSYAPAMQALKHDIMAGTLGRPLRLRTKVLWPRPASYYGRNTWAAKLRAADGHWILDSPVNNATAHYLHNCFYVLGKTRETSARVADVQAELYRANEIENYDTAALRCHTEEGVEILFYTAHPVRENIGPVFSYEFENAVVTYAAWGTPFVATFKDGHTKDYGDPYENDLIKLWQAADAVRTGAPLACGIQAATSHTLCVDGAQESVAQITPFPADLVQQRVDAEKNDTLTWVQGLQEALESCYDQGILPAEHLAIPWAKAGQVIDLRNYGRFEGGAT